MIFLQDTIQPYTFYGSSYTDWIQAVGALIAIIAGIGAFISLFRKDKDKQSQIDSLITLARETQRQTEQLTLQSQHMEESNKLTVSYISVLKENIELDKQHKKQESAQRMIEMQMRKNDILPLFAFNNGSGSIIKITHELMNIGKTATIYDIIYSDNINTKESTTGSIIGKMFDAKTPLFILIRPAGELTNFDMDSLEYSYKLFFEDIDKNKYYQEFKCRSVTGKGEYPTEVNANE